MQSKGLLRISAKTKKKEGINDVIWVVAFPNKIQSSIDVFILFAYLFDLGFAHFKYLQVENINVCKAKKRRG